MKGKYIVSHWKNIAALCLTVIVFFLFLMGFPKSWSFVGNDRASYSILRIRTRWDMFTPGPAVKFPLKVTALVKNKKSERIDSVVLLDARLTDSFLTGSNRMYWHIFFMGVEWSPHRRQLLDHLSDQVYHQVSRRSPGSVSSVEIQWTDATTPHVQTEFIPMRSSQEDPGKMKTVFRKKYE